MIAQTRPHAIPGFEEPFSSLSHLIGAVVFSILGIFLVRKSDDNWRSKVSLGIFAFSCVLLLSLSGVYHLLTNVSGRAVLQRLDHAGIFLLIAGTFTAAHGILFKGFARWGILLFLWSAATVGITLKSIFFEEFPEWLGLSLYVGLGWIGVISGGMLWRRYGFNFIKPLLLGGLSYTIGGLFEFLRMPNLAPGILGPHELFHIFVLGGIAFHWKFVDSFAAGGNPANELNIPD